MKNVAILVHSLDNGGAEKIAGLLSKELSGNYRVYLFISEVSRIVYDYGGEIVDIGPPERLEENIRREKKRLKIDVAISFMEDLNFANLRTKCGESVLISERCAQSQFFPRHVAEDILVRRYYPFADAIISVSEGVRYDLRHTYGIAGDLIRTIYNFVDKESILHGLEELPGDDAARFLDGDAYYVSLGRLEEQKNYKRLILQFGEFVKRGYPDAKLLILGSGALREELETLIEEQNLRANIIIIPFTRNPYAYLAKARGLVLSSRFEGLPNVILDAMGAGVPVIATDCLAGPRELLSDITDYATELPPAAECPRGILVSNADSEDCLETCYLADAMERLWNEDVLRSRLTEAENQYFAQYSNEAILKKWIEAVEQPKRNPIDPLTFEYETLDQSKRIVIYGAGVYGKRAYELLMDRYPIECFVVTSLSDEAAFMGIPIREISYYEKETNEITVVVGVSGRYMNEVVGYCRELGFKKFVFP